MITLSQRQLTGILSFIISVGPVSVDMYLPAFNQIALEFHDPAVPQLSLAWYQIGFAIGQMTFGPLSDWKGRRAALGLGMAIYIVGSVGCGLSPSSASLCAFRALSAFGGAASIVVTRAIVFDLDTGNVAAERLSTVFAWMTVAPLIAPVLGNVVLLAAGWRSIFLVAAFYGVIGGFMVLRLMPETLPPERRLPSGIRKLAVRWGMVLRERGFITHAAIGSCAMFALFAYLGGSAVVFETQYGISSTGYAWILAAISVATIGLLRLNRRLVVRPGWGFARAINLDLGVFLSGAVILVPLVWWTARWPIVLLALLVCAAGFTCLQPNVQPGALAAHQAYRGSAQSMMSTLQYGSGALGSVLLGWLADGTGRAMALLLLLGAVCALAVASARPKSINR